LIRRLERERRFNSYRQHQNVINILKEDIYKMFTTNVSIQFSNLSLTESSDVLNSLDLKDKLQAGWFDLLKVGVESGNIKDFRLHQWDQESQTVKMVYYSDTAEQSRAFRHMLYDSANFMSLVNFFTENGHQMIVDMGLSPAVSLDTQKHNKDFELIRFTWD
jgi:hypothetical protein